MIEFLTAHPMLIVGVFSAGIAAGFAAGLFGIGGGIITVPALYAVFQAVGVSEGQSLKTAIGTSLGVIIITSVRSLMTHHRAGHVDLETLRGWGPWIALGAACGGVASRWIPAELLTVVFAGGGLYIAARRLRKGGASSSVHNLGLKRIKVPVGLGTGLFSSLMGLGGGAVGVLVMTASGRSMHQAVATAAGFGVAVALPGVIGFIWSGWGALGLPPGAFGALNAPAFGLRAAGPGRPTPTR